jgi:predicted TIM-barrel fold metal-dependent hydrolase
MKGKASAFAFGMAAAALGITTVSLLRGTAVPSTSRAAELSPRAAAFDPATWRKEHRIIDLHQHIDGPGTRFDRAIGIMDAAGVGVGTVLGAGTVTHKEGELSQFEKVKRTGETKYRDRFIYHMILDYRGWDAPDWSEKAVRQIEEGHRMGAAGLKEFKRLGLFLKDGAGKLIRIDDPKLDAVWQKCGELGMPISIHVADPKAFWQPYDENNERWTELKDHKSWWFGNPENHPPRMELVEALDRVIARHRKTTFVCVHFGNNPEDIDWVSAALDRNPNMMIDIAARIPEVGRGDPAKVRAMIEKHQDRILFATDFMVYDKLILGSGGDSENPSDADGITFYNKCWKWFETAEKDWPHMTPIQGNWTISSIQLPPAACRKIYFDNARKLFARALPLPVAKARKISRDWKPDGVLDEPEWAQCDTVRLEYQSGNAAAVPELSTPVRLLWSDDFLYLSYECPYTELSVFDPPQSQERMGLWENDVVEAFIGPDPAEPRRYSEYEWAPSGEQLDLKLNLPEKDFAWSSSMESAVKVDSTAKIWRVEVRIPLKSISEKPPGIGTRWKLNLYRHDRKAAAGLAFSPTLKGSFHTPERFGWMEFTGM